MTLETTSQLPLQPDLSAWLSSLGNYAAQFPDESDVVVLFSTFMADHSDAASRRRKAGHLTGSAWLVSADGVRVLLTHHRKLGRWLQLGGHADGDTNLAGVALREAQEESGLADLRVTPDIFDLDRHAIPARGDEPEHWHYDVRYIVRASGSEDFSVSGESHALAWRDIGELAMGADVDASLRRMARKWLARQPLDRSAACQFATTL